MSSSIHKVPNGVDSTVDEITSYLDEIMSQFDIIFEKEPEYVQKQSTEAISAIEKIKTALNRKRSEAVAGLVRKGSLQEASAALLQNFCSLHVGNVEEILRLSQDATTEAIAFVGMLRPELQAAGCRAVFNDLEFTRRLDGCEVWLLLDRLRQIRTPSATLSETEARVGAACDAMADRIAQEAQRKDYTTSIKLEEGLAKNLYSTVVVPKVAAKIFSGPMHQMLTLLEYSRRLPMLSSTCHLIGAAFKMLQEQNLLESEQAMHLWAHAKYTVEEERNFGKIDEESFHTCMEVCGKLSEHQDTFYGYYRTCFEGSGPDLPLVKMLHETNWHVHSLVEGFVFSYFQGDLGKVTALLSTASSMLRFDTTGRFLHSIYKELKRCQLLVSFQLFQLFHSLMKETSLSNYRDVANLPINSDLKELRKLAPRCFNDLLWGDRSKPARLINKYYGEPLYAAPGVEAVFTFVPKHHRQNQLWTVAVNQRNSTLKFTLSDQNLWLTTGVVDSKPTVCAATGPCQWMIKAVDDIHFKIFKSEVEYLVADDLCSTDEQRRFVRLRKEDNTDMQLWKIEMISHANLANEDLSSVIDECKIN